MPTYSDPFHGISLSAALKEAATVAPITRLVLHTYELRHPTIETIRIVNAYESFWATLESTAIEDPDLLVEFIALPVTVTRAEESDASGAPSIQIEVDNVGGLMSSALKLARGSLDIWTITERVYVSDDTSGPAILPPMQLTVTSVVITGAKVQMTAGYGDPANIAVPRLTFTREQYPGLAV